MDVNFGTDRQQTDATSDRESVVNDTDYSKFSDLIKDAGAFHSLTLESFQMHADESEYISTVESLSHSLNFFCDTCEIDCFADDEVGELWFGKINYAEFYLMSKELFQSLHRTLNSELEACTLETTDRPSS